MKKLFLSVCATLFVALTAFNQLSEGHVSFSITVSSEDPELVMAISMFENSTMDIYFQEGKSRSNVSMGGMMEVTTVSNSSTEEIMILMGGMMGNKAVITDSKKMNIGEEDEIDLDVTLSKETKNISGYKCKKATLIDQDGNEVLYWYTDKITVAKLGQEYLNENVPGFPMEFSTNQSGMQMTFTATSVEKKVENAEEIFAITVPDGYEEMTYEEFTSFGM